MSKVTCPVCGQFEFEEIGSWRYCEVCGWQNDTEQFSDHSLCLSANELSVNEHKLLFALKCDSEKSEKLNELINNHTAERRNIHTKYTGADCSLVNTDSMKLELKYEHDDFVRKLLELKNSK